LSHPIDARLAGAPLAALKISGTAFSEKR